MPHDEPNLTFLPTYLGCTAWLVRVNPRNERIPDPITQGPIFAALWEIETCIGDDLLTPLLGVRAELMELSELPERYGIEGKALMAEQTIYSVLTHPRSPYGLGIRHDEPPGNDMIVLWHGRTYTRADDGSMTKVPGPRVEWWPSREHWRRKNIAVRLWARREGLLP